MTQIERRRYLPQADNAGKKGMGRMWKKELLTEFVVDFFRTFFTVTTLITMLLYVLGTNLDPDQRFGYQVFAAPLVYAFVGTIPNVVLLSGHELRGKELFARKALQLLLIEAGVFCVSLYGVESYKRQPELFIVQAAAIFAVYFLATLISWIGSAYSAGKLSRELEEFQKLCAEKE